MLYEGLKQNSSIVIVPSTAVETMQLGGIAGLTALTMEQNRERAEREARGNGHIASTAGPEPIAPVGKRQQVS